MLCPDKILIILLRLPDSLSNKSKHNQNLETRSSMNSANTRLGVVDALSHALEETVIATIAEKKITNHKQRRAGVKCDNTNVEC